MAISFAAAATIGVFALASRAMVVILGAAIVVLLWIASAPYAFEHLFVLPLLEAILSGAAARRRDCIAPWRRGSGKAFPPSCATLPGRKTSEPLILKPGALLIREWRGRLERVTVVNDGSSWNAATYTSLSAAALGITGTKWNGHRFFGVGRRDRIRASERDGDPNRNNRSEGSSALARAVRRTTRFSRLAVRHWHRQARQWAPTRLSDEVRRRKASALRDLHPRLD
jgi:Protein of unknown function (DUF2924)